MLAPHPLIFFFVFVFSPWGIVPPLMLLSAVLQINSAMRFQQSQLDLARNAKKGAEVAKASAAASAASSSQKGKK